MYDVGNPDPGLEQPQKHGGIKPLMGTQLSPRNTWISNGITYITISVYLVALHDSASCDVKCKKNSFIHNRLKTFNRSNEHVYWKNFQLLIAHNVWQ